MDIEEIRVTETNPQAGSVHEGSERRDAETTPESPLRAASCPACRMPSAEAIADAIIRRALAGPRA